MLLEFALSRAEFFTQPRPQNSHFFFSLSLSLNNENSHNSPRGGPPDQAPAQLLQAPVREVVSEEREETKRRSRRTHRTTTHLRKKNGKPKKKQRLPLCQRQQRRRRFRRGLGRRGHPGLSLRVRGFLWRVLLRRDLLDFRRCELKIFRFFFSFLEVFLSHEKKLIFLSFFFFSFSSLVPKQVCIPLPPYATRSGPRKTIYADPATTTAAIVTCGGLCPGELLEGEKEAKKREESLVFEN